MHKAVCFDRNRIHQKTFCKNSGINYGELFLTYRIKMYKTKKEVSVDIKDALLNITQWWIWKAVFLPRLQDVYNQVLKKLFWIRSKVTTKTHIIKKHFEKRYRRVWVQKIILKIKCLCVMMTLSMSAEKWKAAYLSWWPMCFVN